MKTLLLSIKVLVLFTILTGLAYPLFMFGIIQAIYPLKADGSIIYRDGKPVGSSLIGQKFDTCIYFVSRPSAISYNPLPSGGSNLGLTNTKLKLQVEERKDNFIIFNKMKKEAEVPSEMLFASGSGLDPHITVTAAVLQVNRIAEARGFNETQKQKLFRLISDHIEFPQFLIFGEQRINVLLLNLDLDKI